MNRRNFLTLGANNRTDGGPVRLQKGAGTQSPPVFASRSSAGLEPYTGTWGYAQAAHLLRRAMIGPTDADIRKAVTDGMNATVDKLLMPFTPDLATIVDWAGIDVMVRPATSPTDPNYAADYAAWQTELFRRRDTLEKWWLKTIAASPVSIQERLTVFWHNHFVSQLSTVNFAEFMYMQNQLLRTSILGNFKKFVKDITKDVAMLIYLDGVKNSKRANRNNINENYARELQELFTMGVVDWDGNPNYSQTDVSEAARALSGWTLTTSSKGANYVGLGSQFIEATWDNGTKTFLGQTGAWKADDIVDIIFAQRGDQVAKFICGKLYRAFVYDVMDKTVVTQMADAFRSGGWELRPVVSTLLRSAHFYDETNIGAMDRSPVDYMLGSIRGMGIVLTSIPDFNAQPGRGTRELGNRLQTIGQQLLEPPNVKGWEGGRTWVSTSTLPVRQKFSIDVSNAAIERQQVVIYQIDTVAFGKSFPDSDDIHKLAANMAQFLLNTPPSDLEMTSLYNTLLDGGVDYEWDMNDPTQKAGERIRKFLVVLSQLAKYQLY